MNKNQNKIRKWYTRNYTWGGDRVSQMATYWFVIGWFDNQSAQKSKVRQAAKDVVKSEVYPQTYSP